MNNEVTAFLKSFGKWIAIVAVALMLVITGLSSYTKVDSGESLRVQNNVTSEVSWYLTEGYRLKAPFVSNTIRYPQEITIGISDNKENCDTASVCAAPRTVTFADTYDMTLETVNRYSLPRSPELLEKMHDKVKGKVNLIGTTLLPFSQDLLAYTASQYQAEYFLQGQYNDFRNRLIDQAENGLIKTKRTKKLIVTEVANRDSDRESGRPVTGEQYKFEVEPVLDADGQFVRSPTAISEYGITLVPSGISIVDYVPSEELRAFMQDKQVRVRARAGIIEDQENERQRAITIELKGNADRIEKQNALLVEKDAAVLNGERLVETARLQAERETIERSKTESLAVIDKRTEQQMATANLEIQKANALAAKFQGQAIKEVGFANAEVTKANYNAIDKEVLDLEVRRDIAKALYESDINITMPQYVGGTGSGGNGMESISAMSSLKLLEQLSPSTVK
jgi:hypothetical protein